MTTTTGATTDTAGDTTEAAWTAGLERWRTSRLRAVTGPYGSAAVIGTYWLTSTPQELPGLPGRWFARGAEVHAEGLAAGDIEQPATGPSVSRDGTLVLREGQEVNHGRLVLAWFRRLEDQALRVFDHDNPSRTALEGIGTFPANPTWVVEGRLVRTPDTRLTTDQSDGTTYDRELVGRILFTHDGTEHELLAVRSPVPGKPGLMVTFADATSGDLTFRFRFLLLPDPGESDAVTLDFNRAYLPPFAFAPSHSCPLPPAANYLPFAVTAGETLPLVRP